MAFKLGGNPYYSPEKCGLTLIGSLEDPNADYSYNTVVIWKRDESGCLYGAQDSGCSCPTPFEDYTTLEDLTWIRTLEEFDALVKEGAEYDQDEVQELRNKVREALGL